MNAPSEARAGPRAGACVLVLMAWALARPPTPPAPARCAAPREARCAGGWTVWVSCNPETPFHPLRGAAPLLFGQRLDLNRAPAGVLEVLPGIGPSRAAALTAERAQRPFGSVAEVVRARGIGPVTAEGLRGWAEAGPSQPSAAMGGCDSMALARPARAAAPTGPDPDRKKDVQLLPNQNENSYKGRASPARRAPRSGRAR